MSTTPEAVPNLPPNLKLADVTALEQEKTINIPNVNYLFPRLDTPPTFSVVKFRNKVGDSPAIVEEAELHPKIFGAAIRKDIILDAVRYHQLKLRKPYKTKRKSEIRGSNKKPHAQKGIGRAQAGHRRNAIW